MIKMEVDEEQQNGTIGTTKIGIANGNSSTTLGGSTPAMAAQAAGNVVNVAANRLMDLSKASLTLSEAILLGAGRSPLGIALGGSTNPNQLLLAPMAGNSSSVAMSAPPAPTVAQSPPPPAPQPRRKSSSALIGPNGQIQVDCLICSDRATGKHYGSISCDGCKGFFRRTIRKKHNYVCRFNRGCVVDKNQRNSCRRCRFEKCLVNGMRPEAVQLERDRIAATRRCNTGTDKAASQATIDESMENGVLPQQNNTNSNSNNNLCANCSQSTTTTTPTTPTPNPTTTVSTALSVSMPPPMSPVGNSAEQQQNVRAEQTLQRLMEAERTLRNAGRRETAATPAGQVVPAVGSPATPTANGVRTATTGDVTDSMHQQLILLVEWAKQLEEFRRLPLRSQIALLRHFSAQHLVICAAFRSNRAGATDGNDAIWLANDRCVPRDAPKIPDVNRVVARILDHLTAPMRRLHLEDREFVALKAVAFFDPMAKDVEPSAVAEVEEARQRILAAFEYQVTRMSAHRAKMPLRLANLLLLLPPLMAIGRDLVEEAQLAKLFGLANVDELMAELLLPEDAETRSYSRLRTSVTSSIVQSNVTSPTPTTTSPHRQQHFLIQQAAQSPAVASTAGSPQQLIAPTPIYSPATPLVLQLGTPQPQQHPHLLGNFGK